MNITIGTALNITSNPHDMYVLHIEHTHGDDADNKSSTTHKFDSVHKEVLLKTINFCITFTNYDMTNAKELSKIADEKVEEHDMKCTGKSMLKSLMVQDTEYPGMFATISGFWLTYFDNKGIEHNAILSK